MSFSATKEARAKRDRYLSLTDVASVMGISTGEIWGAIYKRRPSFEVRTQKTKEGLLVNLDDIFEFFKSDAEARLGADDLAMFDARRRLL